MTDLSELLREARDLVDRWVPRSHPDVRTLIAKRLDEEIAALAQPPDAEPVAATDIDALLALYEEADGERYRNQMEWRKESEKGKRQGDMYACNFHQGMDAGANWVALYFHRMKRAMDALKKAAPQPPAGKGEPVAFMAGVAKDFLNDCTQSKKLAEEWRQAGLCVIPLYEAPPDAIPREIHERLTADKRIAEELLSSCLDQVKEKDAEIERLRGGAGWLAQLVIDKLGGTPDLPEWVRTSARYYAETIDRAEAAEAALAGAKAQALREAADNFMIGADEEITPEEARQELQRIAYEHERGGS
jgi:hypothetical protein